MQGAALNYVNDSAPLHLASAMDAPVCAVFCSTVSSFGFGPLSGRQWLIQTEQKLDCRPCGLHGKKACPLGHFDCGYGISVDQLLQPLRELGLPA
jgi:heptosyltransferase-2